MRPQSLWAVYVASNLVELLVKNQKIMSIRIPIQNFSFVAANELGAGSVAGGLAYQFNLPQDTDNVAVKFLASVAGAGYSATFQTSDDGGTTWYDVQRTSIVSNANNTTAEWLNIPTINDGVHNFSSVVAVGSVITVSRTIGSSAASTLGVQEVSGLPILGIANRVFVRITGNVTSAAANSYTIQVKANQQSATA